MKWTDRVDLAIYLVGSLAALCSLAVCARLALYVHASVNVFGVLALSPRVTRKTDPPDQKSGKKHRKETPAPARGCVPLFLLVYITATEVWLMQFTVIVVLLLLLAISGAVGRLSLRYVPPGHIGIVRRLNGRTHPDFPQVTPHATHGVLARTLLPGRHWMTPFVYEVQVVPRTRVPEGKIGLVRAKAGRTRPGNRALALPVPCDDFQDGVRFLLNGGEQGTQIGVLAGGQTYSINTELFRVTLVDRVHVPAGTIGLVDARAGGNRPPGALFGPHVECDDFQDGARFLTGGGQQGKQLAILQGGAYYDINPALFDVITTHNVEARGGPLEARHLKQIAIPADQTGVVITLDGADPGEDDQAGPPVPGHQGFRLPWVFLQNGGRRGVQEETLSGGTVSALNPYFIRVMLIPTHLLALEWDEKTPAEQQNYDVHLGRITATVQGYRLFVDVKQLIRIPAQSAPGLVRRNGGAQISDIGGLDYNRMPVQRFVQRVLGAIVTTYFNQIATASTVLEFVKNYRDTRLELATLVENELRDWGVESKGTHLGVFRAEDERLNEMLKRTADEEMESEKLALQLENAEREDAIDKVRVEAERRRVKLELEAEIQVLGLENVMVLKMLREISQAPVPQIVSGGDLSAFLETLPITRLDGLMDRMRTLRRGPGIEGAERPSLPEAESGEAGR
ncbi:MULTISPECIES: SPFH domain-containing protein [Streptomycetaceae]|uniref:SPFH domain-containing protein n=1 Tax=Streptomycetaceae TaxID=2062 RepID=UPI000AD463ED|nr:SPFH domain-containing protein [Streptomyces sp. CB02056]